MKLMLSVGANHLDYLPKKRAVVKGFKKRKVLFDSHRDGGGEVMRAYLAHAGETHYDCPVPFVKQYVCFLVDTKY